MQDMALIPNKYTIFIGIYAFKLNLLIINCELLAYVRLVWVGGIYAQTRLNERTVQCGTGSLLFLVFLRGHSGFSFEEFTEEGRVGEI